MFALNPQSPETQSGPDPELLKKLPRQVRVGHQVFPILWGDQPAREIEQLDGLEPNSMAACVHWTTRTIRVRVEFWKALPTDQLLLELKDSLLHELQHLCYHFTGWEEYDGAKRTQEQVVRALTPTLLMLILDNPDIWRFLGGIEP